MKKLTFTGATGTERVLWVRNSDTVQECLEARGYTVKAGTGEENPWDGRDSVVSASGRLIGTAQPHQIFVTTDDATFWLAWEAIEILYPSAHCDRTTLSRPA